MDKPQLAITALPAAPNPSTQHLTGPATQTVHGVRARSGSRRARRGAEGHLAQAPRAGPTRCPPRAAFAASVAVQPVRPSVGRRSSQAAGTRARGTVSRDSPTRRSASLSAVGNRKSYPSKN
ncbi:hypothetical protein GUJ93_ZPchr0013g35120 [Zizania palustris]|uniref:Uncharacterized protein n=1 Tax=Zizania palustris TaxID=103762 RepID=A0A8J6BWM9_ZIZPA|nr:hypothetical protein GUJ93_ZPchr0013g35120 [Zizania palustris]